MKRQTEGFIDDKYYCSTCKRVIDKPVWLEINEKTEEGSCPKCGERISKRLKN